MHQPDEVVFKSLLFGGILVMVLLALVLIGFFMIYQRRIIAQQQQVQRLQSAYQQQLLVASIEAQENERERIGRDLHDDIGSTLSTVKLLANQVETTGPVSTGLLGRVRELLTDSISNVRHISHNLYPAVLAKFGLLDALDSLVDDWADTRSFEVRFEAEELPRLTRQQELACYRIVQELLNNVARHAQASRATIEVRAEGPEIILTVTDDGRGFPPSTGAPSGVGLRSVEARVAMIGGRMLITSALGQGAQVVVHLPVTPPAS